MKNVKYYTTPELKKPIMIACWTGMGNVGIGAVEYLRTKLGARLFAEVALGDLIAPEAIAVDNGISSIQKSPDLNLYYSKNPAVIISIGKEQLYGAAGVAAMDRLLDVAHKFNVKKIFTCAAFPTYMSHKGDSQIYGVANNEAMIKGLTAKKKIIRMREGHISGLNGLLLEACRKKKIDAACLLATLPIYAVGFPNPKASRALITHLQAIIGSDIDMTELDISAREVDKMFHGIEDQLKQLGIEEDPKDESLIGGSDELPKKIVDKIEKMFEDAKIDKKIAHKLKQELDRWNLFKAYEDRFLDLFKENQ